MCILLALPTKRKLHRVISSKRYRVKSSIAKSIANEVPWDMLICFSKVIIPGTADVIESQSLDHPLSFSKFHRSLDRQIDDLSGEYGRNNYLCTSQDHVGGIMPLFE